MNQGTTLDSASTVAPALRRLASLGPVLCCSALLVSCAPGADQGSPAAEDTAVAQPLQEETGQVEDPGTPAVRSVSVDLPGLPIGGNEVTFSSSARSHCAQVNWTAATLAEGVSVEIRRFDAPEEFAVSSTPCSSAPCLGGFRFTASSTGCDVGIVWNGTPPTVPTAWELTVTDAALLCADDSVCNQALAVIEAVGTATIDLLVLPDETTGSSGEGTDASSGGTG